MTGPAFADDLVQGAVKFLLADATVLAAVGVTDGNTPMVFQRQLFARLEGTQQTAAVISHAGSWAPPNQHNTVRFPRLMLQLWVDPVRDLGGHNTDPVEVWRRIDAMFSVFDRLLHRPQNGEQWWGTVRVISCLRANDPVPYPVPDGDGLLTAQVLYHVEQG